MTTSRKQISLAKPFTLSVPNAREQELEVIDYHDHEFDFLRCKIESSTSYPNPEIIESDPNNGIIKLVFHPTTPAATPLQLYVEGVVSQKIVEKVSKPLIDAQGVHNFWGALIGFFSDMWKRLKTTVYIFIALSILFYAIKDTRTGEVFLFAWEKINAAKIVSIAEELDPRIITNQHKLYDSIAWTQFTADYKAIYGEDKNPATLYNYVGNGFFVTKDLISDETGQAVLTTKGKAENICATIGGQLLTKEELEGYLAGQFIGIENITWPIKLRKYTPEWSSTPISFWDNYLLYVKGGVNPTKNKPTDDGFVEADDGDINAAFRCGFPESYYLPAE